MGGEILSRRHKPTIDGTEAIFSSHFGLCLVFFFTYVEV